MFTPDRKDDLQFVFLLNLNYLINKLENQVQILSCKEGIKPTHELKISVGLNGANK